MNIAVLFGGTSSERSVSIASARQVVEALRRRGHSVRAYDTVLGKVDTVDTTDITACTAATVRPHAEFAALTRTIDACMDVDVVFLALHGGSGEDGTVQGMLDLAGLPYTGSGRAASAIAMDKDISKRLFRRAGVPTPDWLLQDADPAEVERQLGYPVVVKPAKQGSTVGLTIVRSPDDLRGAIRAALEHDDEALIEKFIAGIELTCGVLGNEALGVGMITPHKAEIFDFASKYSADGASEVFPAPIDDTLTCTIKDLSLRVHQALKLSDFSRVDFRVDAAGKPWCLEVNTLPGMTTRSLLPQSAAASGMDFDDLCERMCMEAIARRRGSFR